MTPRAVLVLVATLLPAASLAGEKPPEPELLPSAPAETAAAPATGPEKWPARGDLLYLSVALVGFTDLEMCQRLYVTSLDPSKNQITVTTGQGARDPVFDIRGDYRLIAAPTPRECWQEVRRQAWPIDDLTREELDAKYGGPTAPYMRGPAIDCRKIGRPKFCESRRPIPIVQATLSPSSTFSIAHWVWEVLGSFVTDEDLPPLKPIAR